MPIHFPKKILLKVNFKSLLNGVLILFIACLNFKGFNSTFILSLIGFIFLVNLAFCRPLLLTLLLMMVALGPQIFQMTEIIPAEAMVAGGGFNYPDIILLAMAAALINKILKQKNEIKIKNILKIKKFIVLFILLFIFEILRNFPLYGISAPGEFRYRYLILVLPIYISQFFVTPESRKQLIKMIMGFSVFVTLISLPLIGMLKGWTVGPGSRFLSSGIALGMVYGLMALFLANKYMLVQLKNKFLWMITAAVLTLTLIDSHRSVWLVSLTILILLVVLREIQLRKFWKWGIPVILLVVIVWQISTQSGLNVINYIQERGGEIIDPGEKSTAAWRIAIWKAQFQRFLTSPVLGHGFGGYWTVYVPELRGKINVSPHSFYIQSLVKIGLVGLGLYLIIVAKIFLAFRCWLQRMKFKPDPEKAIVLTSFIVLIASHVYYSVYSLEYYSLLFLGLGIAVIRDQKEDLPTHVQ